MSSFICATVVTNVKVKVITRTDLLRAHPALSARYVGVEPRGGPVLHDASFRAFLCFVCFCIFVCLTDCGCANVISITLHHFVLACPFYSTVRDTYTKPKPLAYTLMQLLSTTV